MPTRYDPNTGQYTWEAEQPGQRPATPELVDWSKVDPLTQYQNGQVNPYYTGQPAPWSGDPYAGARYQQGGPPGMPPWLYGDQTQLAGTTGYPVTPGQSSWQGQPPPNVPQTPGAYQYQWPGIGPGTQYGDMTQQIQQQLSLIHI